LTARALPSRFIKLTQRKSGFSENISMASGQTMKAISTSSARKRGRINVHPLYGSRLKSAIFI